MDAYFDAKLFRIEAFRHLPTNIRPRQIRVSMATLFVILEDLWRNRASIAMFTKIYRRN